ncbi:hypothetical protein BDB00DRAFT_215440 [Zychaea mexicana]|uniref:uncharacterized protein n=1 Tax=Zychaea mexicana TaxID=64656 RepID=UPI0022FDBC93|nr:uncharacterized protein BDB00DRAFT_215440 [Zychaea mexicana]KAI9472954.1 hypothetical protein BDB00DRAFT_215440 [Zychaea mexicana]
MITKMIKGSFFACKREGEVKQAQTPLTRWNPFTKDEWSREKWYFLKPESSGKKSILLAIPARYKISYKPFLNQALTMRIRNSQSSLKSSVFQLLPLVVICFKRILHHRKEKHRRNLVFLLLRTLAGSVRREHGVKELPPLYMHLKKILSLNQYIHKVDQYARDLSV